MVSIFRAQAGNLQGPYCFSNDSLLGPEQGTCKDPIFFLIDSLLGPEQGTCKVPIVFTIIIKARAGNLLY